MVGHSEAFGVRQLAAALERNEMQHRGLISYAAKAAKLPHSKTSFCSIRIRQLRIVLKKIGAGRVIRPVYGGGRIRF